MTTYTTTTHSSTETFALGQRLGRALESGQVVALHGDLGAGKTVLTQGIALGLGITTRVTSPTFTLVSEYQRANGEQLMTPRGECKGHIDEESLSAAEALCQHDLRDTHSDRTRCFSEQRLQRQPHLLRC